MYKIEFQCRNTENDAWRKAKHRLYESEKAFNTYWKQHEHYVNWAHTQHRLVGFKDDVVVRIYPLPL